MRIGSRTIISSLVVVTLCGVLLSAEEAPFHSAELIFPQEKWHNHSSSIVELPNGDLFVCWFHGSGERQSDDVVIQAARWTKATRTWSAPFLLADTPKFPDTNPVLFLDPQKRLWLFWPAILANTWESALMKYRVSSDYSNPGPPRWSEADNILLIPPKLPSTDKLTSRLGWFTRTHPLVLPSGRILLGMYSDGFSFSLMAISDDNGKTWNASEPIFGKGNIQPSVIRRNDGTLVAYMRDNGPPPKRVHLSTSQDDGVTWAPARDTDIPNPGSSLEAIRLRDASWIMVYNDLEKGRHSLAISLSDDEGATWKWTRHLEKEEKGSFHYPSVIQAQDGSIHVTYSYFTDGKAIKHARFNTAWIKQAPSQNQKER